MCELLLEILSEEIPARMQRAAAEQLKSQVTNSIVDAGLTYAEAVCRVTPRRLVLALGGVPAFTQARVDVRKGPRVGAPEQAIQGFLRSAGLTDIDEAEIATDAKKGNFYQARIRIEGKPALEVIGAEISRILASFSWPKSMRWGQSPERWVRPVHNILAIFVDEEGHKQIVPATYGNLKANDRTCGHRFLSPDWFSVNSYEDMESKLHKAKVIVDIDRRRDVIQHQAQNIAFGQNLELVEDPGLLDEVSGLVEWPTAFLGRFDEHFLDLPPEVVRSSIRQHQKCFVLSDRENGSLAPCFILVSNIEGINGGAAIISGNERVVRARLSDALFFWTQDRNQTMESWLPKLKKVIFHEKIGSQFQRVERLEQLAEFIAKKNGADCKDAGRAARLSKVDLVSGMVGEFPELQGKMGAYYALYGGEKAEVAAAIGSHYSPLGPGDDVPRGSLACAVALADKIDQLVGFWAVNERPTSSRDPYALRRAALGTIRIIIENELDVDLGEVFSRALEIIRAQFMSLMEEDEQAIVQDLLKFFKERLRQHLRDQGARHDYLDSVMVGEVETRIIETVEKLRQLEAMTSNEQGKSAIEAIRRCLSILVAEESKDGICLNGAGLDASLLKAAEELALYQQIELSHSDILQPDLDRNVQLHAAWQALGRLSGPINELFNAVAINAEDQNIRRNRLELLAKVRAIASLTSDLSKLEG